MKDKPITVTKPYLPPLAEFIPYLEEIWENEWLTNNGPMHQRLEKELAEFLGVPFVALFNNATNALMVALKALDVKGDVITTPFSFVATSHAISWNGCRPVFVDIDPATLNLDPAKIEAAITPETTAIMPVHCYGIPCDVDAIEAIARKHRLKVIYDAAHAFAVDCHCGSVLNHGDLSVLSFHATKVFNTFEGGAIICQTAQMKRRIDVLKNFGIEDEVTITEIGMNGKMSEVNAAFGLLQLKTIRQAIAAREQVAKQYLAGLADIPGIRCLLDGIKGSNYGYFPILLGDKYPLGRDELYERLKASGIMSRRYFHPLLSDLSMYRNLPSAAILNLPEAHSSAERVLCLPVYAGLSAEDQSRIIEFIRSA